MRRRGYDYKYHVAIMTSDMIFMHMNTGALGQAEA